MDKIWDENPSMSDVIGRCGGDEKTKWPHRKENKRTLKTMYLGKCLSLLGKTRKDTSMKLNDWTELSFECSISTYLSMYNKHGYFGSIFTGIKHLICSELIEIKILHFDFTENLSK